MKIIRLMGGLGNQMFQYAFGLAMGGNVRYDTSWFDKTHQNPNVAQREYELDFWNINPQLTNKTKIWGIIKRKRIIENPYNIYNPELLKIKNGVVEGYFQVAAYYEPIRERLLHDFVPRQRLNTKNREVLDLMHRTNSISLHVRRGDYVKLQNIYGVCDLDYYKHAIAVIANNTSNPYFFMFSDDIEWTTNNLAVDFPHMVVDINHGHDSAWDMWLMANCKHNIIANSSFSWWGAWLNQNPGKIVISPAQWFANGTPTDIIPDDWARIQNENFSKE